MKTTIITVALLVAVASVSEWAQSGGKLPDRRPTPTAEGVPSSTSRQSSQTTPSGQKNGSSMGTGSARSQSGSGPVGSQSTGTTSGQGGKGKGKKMNQQAAGVPKQ